MPIPSTVLAAVDLQNPLVWAVIIGWIMSVVVHEFAHGLVAFLGGDHTIRERGGLTLNPLQYIDPVMSILLPAVFIAMGGVPLPGGATFINHELIRSKAWLSAVSLAGPASNLILFVLIMLPLHPAVGWVTSADPSTWNNTQLFLATLGTLQFIAVILNLVPLPPLDGFRAILPYMPYDTQEKFRQPVVNFAGIAVLFMVVTRLEPFWDFTYELQDRVLGLLGFGPAYIGAIGEAFNRVMFS